MGERRSQREDRRVTSVDVAREAGLSRATVSYVLNGNARQTIPEVTRQRVLEAAARLGYRPYGPARLLRGARSSVVLMFTEGLEHASDFVAVGIITKLGKALRERGLHLVWQLGTEERDTSVDLAPTIVLSSAAEGEPQIAELATQFSVPVLSAFPGLDGFIGAAAVAQVEHLADQGRRTLAYAAPARRDLAKTSNIRLAAARSAAKRLGLPKPVTFTVPAERDASAAALSELLVQHPNLDGFCTFNDEVAFALLAAAHDAGVDVPKRIAVVGVDNHPLGSLAIPALTTVESDVDEFVASFADYVTKLGRGEVGGKVLLPAIARVVKRLSA